MGNRCTHGNQLWCLQAELVLNFAGFHDNTDLAWKLADMQIEHINDKNSIKRRENIYKLKSYFIQATADYAAYSVCRFLFYIFNTNYFRVDAIELLIAFVAGLRFDISAILYTNFIFILLHLIPGEWKYRKQVQKITFWIFIIVNSTFLLLNFIDIEYYSFVNKRSTWDLFYFVQTSGDIWNLIPVFIIDYWHIILLWGLTVFDYLNYTL